MDKPAGTPDAGRLSLEDEDVEDLFASPSDSGTTGTQKPTPTSQTSSAQKRHSSRSRQQEADARDAGSAQNSSACGKSTPPSPA